MLRQIAKRVRWDVLMCEVANVASAAGLTVLLAADRSNI